MDGLLERVKAATGPDGAIDAALAAMFRVHWTSADHWINRSSEVEFRPSDRDGWIEIWMPGGDTARDRWKATPYTASIDAALALVERVLPGWTVQLFIHPDAAYATLYKLGDLHHVPGGSIERRITTPYYEGTFIDARLPAPAILAALLSAKSGRTE